MNLYLAQFKRGWSYTAVYLLRDRTDEAGNQTFGFFQSGLLAPQGGRVPAQPHDDPGRPRAPGPSRRLDYPWPTSRRPSTTCCCKSSDGQFQELVVWGERLKGSDPVQLDLRRQVGGGDDL